MSVGGGTPGVLGGAAKPALLDLYWAWARELGCTRVADVSEFAPVGLAVTMAVRPCSATLTAHQGKGLTVEEACYSALGESIETAIASVATMTSENGFEAEDLCREGGCFEVPSRAVVLSMRLASRAFESLDAYASSGGLAIHGSRQGALDHALSEVVERPLAAGFLASGLAERDIGMELARNLLGEIATRIAWDRFTSVSFYVLGLWPLYTVAACVEVHDFGPGHRFAGFGSHRCLGGALRAGLLEAVQSYVTHVVGFRDDIPHRPSTRPPRAIRLRSESSLEDDPGALELSTADIATAVASERNARVGVVDLAERHSEAHAAFVVKCVSEPTR